MPARPGLNFIRYRLLLMAAQLAGLLIFTVGFGLQALAVKGVAELGVQVVVVRLVGNCFAVTLGGAWPLLFGEVFVAEREDGSVAGFVEVGSRPYADGCETSPVAYIEAWYVDPDVRRSGYGRDLLKAAENWARSRGYHEMASDALLDNEISHAAHYSAGYEEVDRVVQFRKGL